MGAGFELLRGAEALFPRVCQEIAQARRRVWLETYLLHDDDATRGLLQALGQAAQRGLDIRLLVDGFGGGAEVESLRPWLRGMGVEVRVFRPRLSLWSPRAWRRLHRKLILVDDDLLYVGGINLLSDWVDPNHGRLAAPRLDYAVRCHSTSLQAQAALVMAKTWWRTGLRAGWVAGEGRLRWQQLRRDLAAARAPAKAGGSSARGVARLVFRDDPRQPRAIEREVARMLQGAKSEIRLAMAYFVPTRRLRKLLEQAAQRGVRVSVLIQGRTEYWWARWAEQLLVQRLLSRGIEVWEYRESFLHAKVLVADDWATVGSSNWDPLSLWLAREANLVLRSPRFAQQLSEDLGLHMVEPRAYRLSAASGVKDLVGLPSRMIQRLLLGLALALLRSLR